MCKQYRLLHRLQEKDPEALTTLMVGCGDFLAEYCAVRLGNWKRGQDAAFHLFIKWIMDGFMTATLPLSEWMAAEAEAECCRLEVSLN